MNKAVMGGLFLMLIAGPGFAATIDVGEWTLLENTPGQTIPISVSPGDPVEQTSGMDLLAQIADTGPDLQGTVDGPEFTGADMVTGTIWEVNPIPTPVTIPAGRQILLGGVILAGEGQTVPADGLLVTLTVDTTGFFRGDGPWPLKLTDTVGGDTSLAVGPVVLPGVDVINGTIFVPEPATIMMLLALLACVPVVYLWEKRKRAK